MNPTLYEIITAVLMIAVAIVLVAWFRKYKASGSERRMKEMLMKAGLDPDFVAQGDTENIIKEVRSRCSKCQAEDVCERWLAGEATGENEFCPNAGVFRILAEQSGVSK